MIELAMCNGHQGVKKKIAKETRGKGLSLGLLYTQGAQTG